MQDLIQQERFELEVLDSLNSGRLLRSMVFTGGTMLRLCHGLPRYSVDLDFWITTERETRKLCNKLREWLSAHYAIRDATDKLHTMVFELRSPEYRRSLKIGIRKLPKPIVPDKAIAYSPHSSIQVLLDTVPLRDMMEAKIEAFLSRGEIRDAFDLEFLVTRGVSLDVPPDKLGDMLRAIESLKRQDYTVRLGSLLDAELRKYYIKENFKILKEALKANLFAPGGRGHLPLQRRQREKDL